MKEDVEEWEAKNSMLYLYIIYLIKHRPIVLYAHVRSRVHARVRREKDICIYVL